MFLLPKSEKSVFFFFLVVLLEYDELNEEIFEESCKKYFLNVDLLKANLIWEFVLYLFVVSNGLVSLKDHENFRSFDILTENNDPSTLTRSEDFLLISEDLGNGHYWLEAKAVARLSLEYEDKDWIKSYWEMLTKAQPFGYFDPIKCQIKAHLVEQT